MSELAAFDGHTFSTYRADPTDTPKGAVVVLHEIFGINSHVKKVVDAFAAQGYVAIAPALFDRIRKDVALGYSEAEFAEGFELMKKADMDDAFADIQATVDSVRSVGKVAVVGYCWGGTLAYVAANQVKNLACAIGYYGAGIPADYGAKRKIPTLLHFGENDEYIDFEAVTQFRARRPDVSVFAHKAGHGFNCDERPSYDAAVAEKALEQTLFWISQFVVGQPKIQLKNAGSYALAKEPKKKKKAAAGGDDMGPPPE
jgi:carboxymethylenebutenolidase